MTKKSIAQRLIRGILDYPFPFQQILEEQFRISTWDHAELTGYFRINFQLKAPARPLPRWIEIVPISWQAITDNSPITCQLYITENGYINYIEVVDMSFNTIDWDVFFAAPIHRDYEYDSQKILDILSGTSVTISNIEHWSSHLMIGLTDPLQSVVNFRKCNIRKIKTDSFPLKCKFMVEQNQGTSLFSFISTDGNIDFNCEFLYMHYNALLGQKA